MIKPVRGNGMNSFNLHLRFFLSLILIIPALSGSYAQDIGARDGSVTIGLLITDSLCNSAVRGCEIAVSRANKAGGLNGKPFRLAIRSMEGPWGTGSKQAVDLIFKEKVWALIGSHDGRNAHLVEQAATRTTVVFLSAWSGDPTLSQAFVPWFFNCVPNYLQQAKVLVNEIFEKQNQKRAIVISDSDYDSGSALSNFLKISADVKNNSVVQFRFEDYAGNTQGLIDKIKTSDPACIIMFCKPRTGLALFRQIRNAGLNIRIYGSLTLLNEDLLSDKELKIFDNDLLVPLGTWNITEFSAFRKDYRELFGRSPAMVSAFAFDCMNVLIEAIKKAGNSDREKIQKALYGLTFKGVTGSIRFDSGGNRSGNPEIVRLSDGIPSGEVSGKH